MTAKYPRPGGADGDGRLDMIELLDGHDLASEQPRVDRPPDDDHGEECVAQPWPESGGDHHGQQDRREGSERSSEAIPPQGEGPAAQGRFGEGATPPQPRVAPLALRACPQGRFLFAACGGGPVG